jgi:hypothetical protein
MTNRNPMFGPGPWPKHEPEVTMRISGPGSLAGKLAADLRVILSEATKNGTVPLLKTVAIYLSGTEIEIAIRALEAGVPISSREGEP